ncbi:MAG: hypothetical protein JWP97_5078 [Labilithrix sp.]|nr:hypothetical protein [Labilithrix sp.]
MNNPYASPAPQIQPAGGYGAPTHEAYRGGDNAEVSAASVELLRQTKPWVTFLSVMGFIGSAFMLLGGVFMMIAGAFMPKTGPTPFSPMLLGVIYLPMAFVYIYPSLKLWSFSGAIGRLLAQHSAANLEAALLQQKSFWKFVGILTIAMMVLYALFIVGMIVVGFSAAALSH